MAIFKRCRSSDFCLGRRSTETQGAWSTTSMSSVAIKLSRPPAAFKCSESTTPSKLKTPTLSTFQPYSVSQHAYNYEYSRMADALISKEVLDRATDLWDSEVATSFESQKDDCSKTDLQDVEMAEGNQEVTLVGSDGFSVKCSGAHLCDQSDRLVRMLGGKDCVELPVSYKDLEVLAEALDYRSMAFKGWGYFRLEDLVRAVDMFVFYEFKYWPAFAIESAILRHLETGRHDHDTRLGDERYIAKVRSSAQQAGMYRLLTLIDREKPSTSEQYESEDCRPRKWQKISAHCAKATMLSNAARVM